MSIACIGAIGVGSYLEAAVVIILFKIGESIEGYASKIADKGVTNLMELKKDTAVLLIDNKRKLVLVDALNIGDIIEVTAGDRLPVDGCALNGGSFDYSLLTGESLPVFKKTGDEVQAGCLVIDSKIEIKVTSKPGSTTIDKIINLIEEAENNKAPIARFIDKFSAIYTPIMILLAVLITFIPPLLLDQQWLVWIYRSLSLLLIACPCALVISTPAAVASALARASQEGALIKGGAGLEKLASINLTAFDKTGTLTTGKFEVAEIKTIQKTKDINGFVLAASIAQSSKHPLDISLVNFAKKKPIFITSNYKYSSYKRQRY